MVYPTVPPYMPSVYVAVTALFTYTFMKYYHGNSGPYVNFAVAMLSMSICHIDRQLKGFEGSSKLDYSGALMILTVKFSSFGFNVMDGRLGAVTDYSKRMKIDRYPSLIEYFGWLCFFGGFLVGPTCEYMDYYRFTNFFFLSPDKNLSPYKPALRKILLGAFTAWIVVYLGHYYNYFRMMEPEFASLPLYKKVIAFEIVGRVQHCKYGCLWLLTEGSCVLSGFGYNGIKKGKHNWDRLSNVDWYLLEMAQSFRDLSNGWNLGANVWLKNYVYLRLSPPGTKPTSFTLVATYGTSSMWHGFHPGYYGLLVSTGLFQALGRNVRRVVRPLVMSAEDPSKPLPVWKALYDAVSYVATMQSMALLMAPFELLYVSRTLKVWASYYYIHVWGYVITWMSLFILGPTLQKIQKRRQERAAANVMNERVVKELKLVQKTVE
ncbi:MBOAT, membrane-bound O-acyltransferase family-domain-containing protein [Zychaea mexicana]|uniref:MBOAT, membrane-bound O-acyltransferase family-domain-containing protein n=1 Tax=Zychaea mexicana TaxID=64656 RepID=UPI0022FDEDDA|nr:MBOAT, membrane-bound O-acyltransferase family-domain-containing protein [Zychaea mexicana]KAI9493897.1 MBOAT, membrane-bound O-acyltransferase family-domain-containing protein [Zychaea mexicana]